jgi:dCMP deaminase
MRPTWDIFYLGMAEYVASRSKDPSTKVGAVIVRPDKTVCSVGYNGFPRAIEDKQELLDNRDEKYKRVVHAEMNAILNAREPLQGYTLYLWPYLSCERCAVHVIQAGIETVVAPQCEDPETLKRWGESWRIARSLYEEAKVTVWLI